MRFQKRGGGEVPVIRRNIAKTFEKRCGTTPVFVEGNPICQLCVEKVDGGKRPTWKGTAVPKTRITTDQLDKNPCWCTPDRGPNWWPERDRTADRGRAEIEITVETKSLARDKNHLKR